MIKLELDRLTMILLILDCDYLPLYFCYKINGS